MSNILTKELILAEDFEFGFEPSAQDRTGNQFNASYIPYTATESITTALNNRYTNIYVDNNFAKINGTITENFLVKDAVNSNDAVNLSQLALKADQSVVDAKADINGNPARKFRVADAVNGDEAYSKNQVDSELALKDTIINVDSKLESKAEMLGNPDNIFEVDDASLSHHAVNLRTMNTQLDLKANLQYTNNELADKADKSNVLEKDGNAVYNPLFDYNPSTKRYVDDSISTAFQQGTSGSFTSADGKTINVINGLIVGII